MIQKIKITMVEFKEVKVFNPLKFWKGRHIVEQFVEKNTQQFVFNGRQNPNGSIFGLYLSEIYTVRHNIEWATHFINPNARLQNELAVQMIKTARWEGPITIKTSHEDGRKREFTMEYIEE